MRGKRGCRWWCRPGLGLIPAHAGKTGLSSKTRSAAPAHPRSCGENAVRRATSTVCRGSSPLMRGKRLVGTLFQERVGLIPAHAGKRACTPQRKNRERLIPAHAGKTLRGSRPLAGSRAHPHARGENMRQSARVSFFPGLIPAHAGKNRPARRRTSLRGAHPRSCEENRVQARRVLRLQGSSPLTRGKPRGEGAPCVPEGLIPAHAGITSETRPCPRCGAAHPRSRGENASAVSAAYPASGSSPLTRGKPQTHPPRPS